MTFPSAIRNSAVVMSVMLPILTSGCSAARTEPNDASPADVNDTASQGQLRDGKISPRPVLPVSANGYLPPPYGTIVANEVDNHNWLFSQNRRYALMVDQNRDNGSRGLTIDESLAIASVNKDPISSVNGDYYDYKVLQVLAKYTTNSESSTVSFFREQLGDLHCHYYDELTRAVVDCKPANPLTKNSDAGENPLLVMQNDGNLVLYNSRKEVVWASSTAKPQ